jgi:Staphylococcal nuclease homologue
MYGRGLAVIVLEGNDVNLEQVRSGLAWVYDRCIVQAGAGIQASYRQALQCAWLTCCSPFPDRRYAVGFRCSFDAVFLETIL